MLVGVTALGFWDIVGNEIYETRIKPFLRPPIVAFPEKHRIDRSLFRVYSFPFYIKNRSSETHYSIEARVYIGDLEENFEKLEVESISRPE